LLKTWLKSKREPKLEIRLDLPAVLKDALKRNDLTHEYDHLFRKIDFSGPVPAKHPELGPCWIWRGAKTGNGVYGRTGHEGKRVSPHHVLYELVQGPIPEGLEADHLCEVEACCHPAHIEPVTHTENQHRRAMKNQSGFVARHRARAGTTSNMQSAGD
jgi:hypothetical protein